MGEIEQIPVEAIEADPSQPRKDFNGEALVELAKSIEHNGLLQPVVVRPWNGRYRLIAGERRWRAVRTLGWNVIPAIVCDVTDTQARKLQLLENIVRADLNPLEVARAYKSMIDQGLTAKEVGEVLGKDASVITYYVNVLRCRDDVLQMLGKGQIKMTLAWHLARLSENGQMIALRRIQSGKMSLDESVMVCEMVYAQEHQLDMFPDTELTDEEVRVARQFRSAFDRAVEAMEALRKVEEQKHGAIREAIATELDSAIGKVKALKHHLTWLEKALKRRKVNGDSADEE